MSNIKIVFFGTPHFAVAALKALVENNHEVVGVVTAPDKPAGRGRSLKESAVKEYALSRNLKVLQPSNLKSEEFHNILKELQPDLQVVVAFRMLPEAVWALPKLGTFNLHASLLPQYRGAAPINWAIINGETKTGVTTFFIDDKIDTGEIIDQEEVSIETTDNAGTLHDKLMATGSQLVLKTVDRIASGKIKTLKQPAGNKLKTAYKLHAENTKIDWNKPALEIQNLIKGLSPYPAAWSFFMNGKDEMTVKIFSTHYEILKHPNKTGVILSSKKEIKVAVKDGYILIDEIQLAGKKKMDVASLLNGFKIEKNAKMR